MTDLSVVLPGFATQQYAHLIPSLERNLVNTTDLITLDAVDIAKRAQLPLLDLKRLCNAVLGELQRDLGLGPAVDTGEDADNSSSTLRKTGDQVIKPYNTISTLDNIFDNALGNGIPTGYITELTGESGAGKTQFLLGLLLATQLPSPRGLSRSALYISTESALPTSRLSQMLLSHPVLTSGNSKPSLDRVISIVTPDLESQDHILRYQLPVAIRRHKIGLVVLDSVAANYRAEFEHPGASRTGAHMVKRSAELVKLGQLLRDLARTENIAIVVANQVADRFAGSERRRQGTIGLLQQTQSSPLMYRDSDRAIQPHSSSTISQSSSITIPSLCASLRANADTLMTLDHQQRWLTGWGDDPNALSTDLKTPSLGLIWSSQIACRIALIKSPIYADGGMDEDQRGERVLKGWKRWMKVVFAPWIAPSGAGIGEGAVEFEITGAGIRAITGKEPNEPNA